MLPAPRGVRLQPVRRVLVLVLAVCGLVAAAGHPGGALLPGPPTQPPQPPPGEPGGPGPCGLRARVLDNPGHRDGAAPQPVWVFEPTGDDPGTAARGRCDSRRRPMVVIAHGFGWPDPVAYAGLIEHLVSVGNIVVYPSYEVGGNSRADLEESYRVVDAGVVAAVAQTPRADTSRVGWWGHSHGGGMIPWLVQQGDARGWGRAGVWMSMVGQAYTQLVGTGPIAAPARAEAMTVAFQHDEFADARLGIDVFESLQLPPAQQRHVTVHTDLHGQPAFVANHGAPLSYDGDADAVDFLLWRYVDLLQRCAHWNKDCDADLSTVGTWSDGRPIRPALVSTNPVDVGPYPALLAECDTGFGPIHNARIDRCGTTRLGIL